MPDDFGDLKVEDVLRPESVKHFRRDRRSSEPLWLDLHFRARDGVETQMQTATSWAGRGVGSPPDGGESISDRGRVSPNRVSAPLVLLIRSRFA